MKRHTILQTLPMLVLVVLSLTTCLHGLHAEEPGKTILDMTFPFDEAAVFWPTAQEFRQEKVAWRIVEGGWWYASNNFSLSEHGGTHLDAPIHFFRDGRKIHEIEVAELIGPAVRIDVAEKCGRNRDYLLTVRDIEEWEDAHGRIPEHAWVLMYTGIDSKWYPDRKRVLGTDVRGRDALPLLSFPSFSPEAAAFLLEKRAIRGIGVDTPSIDYGKSTDFRVHRIICEAGRFGLENINNLDRLPDTGATLYVVPMLIKNGTGSPSRVFAVIP